MKVPRKFLVRKYCIEHSASHPIPMDKDEGGFQRVPVGVCADLQAVGGRDVSAVVRHLG